MKNKIKNTYTIKKEIDFYVYIKVEASDGHESGFGEPDGSPSF